MIIIPIKWLFHWEYTLFSDKPILLAVSQRDWHHNSASITNQTLHLRVWSYWKWDSTNPPRGDLPYFWLIFRSFPHVFTSQPLESSVKPLLGRSPNWWSPPVTFLRQASPWLRTYPKNLEMFPHFACRFRPVSATVQALLHMVAGDHFSWSRLIALELCDWPGKPEACLRLLEADELTLKPAAILCLENWMVNGDMFWKLGKLYENTRKYMVKACFSENGQATTPSDGMVGSLMRGLTVFFPTREKAIWVEKMIIGNKGE